MNPVTVRDIGHLGAPAQVLGERRAVPAPPAEPAVPTPPAAPAEPASRAGAVRPAIGGFRAHALNPAFSNCIRWQDRDGALILPNSALDTTMFCECATMEMAMNFSAKNCCALV